MRAEFGWNGDRETGRRHAQQAGGTETRRKSRTERALQIGVGRLERLAYGSLLAASAAEQIRHLIQLEDAHQRVDLVAKESACTRGDTLSSRTNTSLRTPTPHSSNATVLLDQREHTFAKELGGQLLAEDAVEDGAEQVRAQQLAACMTTERRNRRTWWSCVAAQTS